MEGEVWKRLNERRGGEGMFKYRGIALYEYVPRYISYGNREKKKNHMRGTAKPLIETSNG